MIQEGDKVYKSPDGTWSSVPNDWALEYPFERVAVAVSSTAGYPMVFIKRAE